MTELSEVVLELRQALDDLEAGIDQQPSAAALEDFKVILDAIRTRVRGILTAEDPSDHHLLVRHFRLRHAAQICQNVLSGLVDGTINDDTAGFDRFRSTVEESVDRLDRFADRGQESESPS